MLTFNGNNLKCLHEWPRADAPKIHAQRNQFPGVWGESQILLGVGGRDISISVWLTDASFTTAAAVDAYRQLFDLSVGTTATLQITGNAPAAYGDVCFDGFEASGSVLPAIGGAPLMPNGTFWQSGVLHFHQLTVP
jgi:hypothetical protein